MTANTWAADTVHSEILFKVKHLMISTVNGKFNDYKLTLQTEGNDFNTAKNISFIADVKSINTGNSKRDEHLRSADFFNASLHDKIIFSGTKYEGQGDEGILTGDLTIGGITKSIKLVVEQGGVIKDPWGGERAGFSVSGKISRKEFGLTYNPVTEAGGVVVGDEVKIIAEVQLVKQVKASIRETAGV